MRIVVEMTNGKKYEVERDFVTEFLNDETGEFDALPATFYGYEHDENGCPALHATLLYGIDINRLWYP